MLDCGFGGSCPCSALAPSGEVLKSYLDLVRALPVPTDGQVEAFLSFVSEADNWLKLLPLHGGPQLTVWLDPNAGARVNRVAHTGKYVVEPLTPRSELLHGSEMPTDEYRRRHGFLTYHVQTGGGTAGVEDGVLVRAMLPEPGVIHAGELVPVPDRLRGTGTQPGAFLHGTLRGASDAGGRRRFRYAVERLGKLDSVTSDDPLIERIRAWTRTCKEADDAGFHSWMQVRGREPAALDEAERWRFYVEWRDDEACMRLHAEQDDAFEKSGIPAEIVRAHTQAIDAVRRAVRGMLRVLHEMKSG